MAQGQSEFHFRFTAEMIDRKPLQTSCKMAIGSDIIDAIDNLKRYGPTCFPDN